MSYNIDKFKVKRLFDLKIPVTALYVHERTDFWPEPDVREITLGSVGLEWCEVNFGGFVHDGWLTVMNIDLSGEGSGTFVHEVFEPALKKSTGVLDAVCIWEGGDSINRLLVEDGEVDWLKIDL